MPDARTRVSFQIADRPEGRKTDLWEVWSLQRGIHLGQVKWFKSWRKYAFHPDADRVFDEECLREIATFCELETRGHVVARRAFRE